LTPSHVAGLNSEYIPDPGLEELLCASEKVSVVKLLLKAKLADMLLHKTVKLGYDGARLFPDYAGTVRGLKEHVWGRIGLSL
jgi:hypothetical protein